MSTNGTTDPSGGSGTLEVRGGGDVVGKQEHVNTQAGFSGPASALFQAVQLASEDDLLEVRETGTHRGRHLGFRVTGDYLDSFKANTHLVAALNRTSVEHVNTVILNELMKLFPTVNQVVGSQVQARRQRR